MKRRAEWERWGIKKEAECLGQTASLGSVYRNVLFDNIQFFANLDESGDGAVELFAGVCC